ncbi:MAG: DNA-processing protein DprA [Candidatus Omnitrophota bacterium]|jgi:DNA processing protein
MSAPGPEEIKTLLLLNRYGQGRDISALLDQQVPAGNLLETVLERRARQDDNGPAFDAAREVEECGRLGIRILTYFDEDYPALLREIPGPPPVLYVAGSILPCDEAAVAIVGTRHPSLYGTGQARRFGRELAEKGLTIVSGFARGIDRSAHEASLEIPHGRTIAVLGCGLDVDYPKDSRGIYGKIASRGAVVSEYALGTRPRAEHFPRRNRIISGLTLGTIVIEAHERSGSLITAHEAADQGREVFAVPGMVDQLTSLGTHRLLKEGANFAATPRDVFEVLAPMLLRARCQPLCPPRLCPSADQDGASACSVPMQGEEGGNPCEAILLKALGEGPLAMEEISRKCSLEAALTVMTLTRLEVLGKVVRRRDGRYLATG